MMGKNQSVGKGQTKWLGGPSCGPRATCCSSLIYAICSCETLGSLQIDIASPHQISLCPLLGTNVTNQKFWFVSDLFTL